MTRISRQPLDSRAVFSMLLLCTIWGMQQVAVKAAAPFMAPVLQLGLRSGVAALVIFALVCARRELWALRGGTMQPGLFVGMLLAMEFFCIGEGLRFTSASHMSIFLYTAPVFAALGLHFHSAEERLRPLQWGGVSLAFAGVAIAFAGGGDSAGERAWIGDLLGLAGGALWGATTLVVRFSRLSETPATVTLLYQLVGACALLLPAAMVLGQTQVQPGPLLWASLGFQTFVVSTFSFLIWFTLLRRYLASRLGILSFLSPVLGVVFGVWLLGERPGPGFLIGAVCVLAGILLVGGVEWRRRAAAV